MLELRGDMSDDKREVDSALGLACDLVVAALVNSDSTTNIGDLRKSLIFSTHPQLLSKRLFLQPR